MRARALVVSSAVAGSVLAALAAPFSGAAATTRPAAVSGLAAFQKQGPVTLAWTNPGDLDRDVVRLARGTTAPATPQDGRAVRLAHPRASHAVLDHLGDGRQYSVSVWTKRDGSFSRRATTTFTTKSFRSTPAGPGTFAGHVVDTSGDPLRNALVVAIDYDTFSHEVRTHTDALGAFSLDVPRGRYLIGAAGPHAKGGTSDASGYLYDFVQSPVHTGRSGLRFVLADGGAVTGVVTDSHGAPLKGVAPAVQEAPAYVQQDSYGSVLVLSSGPGSPRTDATGHYRITGLPPGTWVPCFATRGATGGSSDGRGYVARCADRSVAVTARHASVAAPEALQSAPPSRRAGAGTGAVAGTVTNANGSPARGTRVVAFRNGAPVEARTSATGHYALRHLAAGAWDVCAIRPPGDTCKRVSVVAGRTSSAAFHFKPSGTLSGVVYGPRGDRLANASLSAEHLTRHGGWGVSLETDEHGAWTLGGLTPGLWHICFSGGTSADDPIGGRSRCLAKKVLVVAGRDRIGVDVRLAPGGAVAGVVTDSAGHPVTGANVSISKQRNRYLFGQDTSTDSRGRFLAGGLAPGSYRVCAEVDYDSGGALQRCTTGRVAVVAGRIARSAVIALPADAPLTATVTDAAGNPLGGVDVALLRSCPTRTYCPTEPIFNPSRSSLVAASAVTEPDGTVVFHGLQPGHYAACAAAYYAASASTTAPATGYADKCTGSSFTLDVTRGGAAATALALEPGAAVSGRVVNAAGTGLPGVTMRVAGSAADDFSSQDRFSGPLDPSPYNDVLTRPDGSYLVRSVVPGTRAVCGMPPRGLRVRRACLADPVDLAAGTTTTAPDLTLPATAGAAQAARIAMTTRLDSVRPGLRYAPVERRLSVVSSTGWPEYRLLPRH